MKFFIIIMTIIFLAGCSPARRMQRLLNCHPELIRTDTVLQTITVRDTIKIPGTEIDTFFMSMDADTSRSEIQKVLDVKKDSLSIRIFRTGSRYDVNVKHNGNVIPIEKKIVVPVQVKKVVVQPKRILSLKSSLIVATILLFFLLFFGEIIHKMPK